MRLPHVHRLVIGVLFFCVLVFLFCSLDPVAGTGVNTGNPVMAGRVVDSTNNPRAGVSVSIIPPDWSPFSEQPIPANYCTSTDSSGRFSIGAPDARVWNVEINTIANKEKALLSGVGPFKSDTDLGTIQLQPGGYVKVLLPDTIRPNAWGIYIPGTSMKAVISDVDRLNGSVLLSGVYAGYIPSPAIIDVDKNIIHTIRDSLRVLPNDSVTAGEAVFYVSPNGNDIGGDGSRDAPWKTIAYTCTEIPEMWPTKIVLDEGTYVESVQVELPPLASLIGAGSVKTVVTPGKHLRNCIQSSARANLPNNQRIGGLSIDGKGMVDVGIRLMERENVTVEDVTIRGTDSSGICIVDDTTRAREQEPDRYIQNITVKACSLIHTAGLFRGAFEIAGIEKSIIEDVYIADSVGIGIVSLNRFCKNVKIRNCVISTAAWKADEHAEPGIALHRCYDNCEISACILDYTIAINGGSKGNGTRSVIIHNNRIVFDASALPASGIRMHASDLEIHTNYIEGASFPVSLYYEEVHSLLVHHNVFYSFPLSSNDGSGCELHLAGETIDTLHYFNNVLHCPPETPVHVLGLKLSGQGTIKNFHFANNIYWVQQTAPQADFLSPHEGKYTIENLNVEYNLFSGNIDTAIPDGQGSNNSVADTPGIIAAGERPIPFYYPLPDGNLRNAGVNVGLGYEEDAPDIGAYEYK